MSHRKASPATQPAAAPQPTVKTRTRGTKEEVLQMVQALSEKIQKDPEKSARILTDWMNRGKSK